MFTHCKREISETCERTSQKLKKRKKDEIIRENRKTNWQERERFGESMFDMK